jgi:site-specific DNA-methyltransferase (adenine-specific)
MGLSIRLAGFEIRDTITWLYASGFPKGLDISKAIDKAAGAEREVVGPSRWAGRESVYDLGVINDDSWSPNGNIRMVTAPATEAAKQWDGWNVALKPASEPIIVARKPFPGTVVANVQRYGTGGININACRVNAGQDYYTKCASVVGLASNRNGDCYSEWTGARMDSSSPQGRWPANVILSHASTPDGEDLCRDRCIDGCPVLELDRQSGERPTGSVRPYTRSSRDHYSGNFPAVSTYTKAADNGGASRFFNVFRYQAKAPKSERPIVNGKAHPTVKPLALVEHLVALFTASGGVVLDPFAGTGTLGQAAHRLEFDSILIEENDEWLPHIDLRLTRYLRGAA